VPEEKRYYLDEMGVCEKDMNRLYGYIARGERLHGQVSGKRAPRHNVIAVCNGNKLHGIRVRDENFNTDNFNDYISFLVEKILPRGACLIMDNARFHKISPQNEALMRQKSITVRFLPPYSPQLNVIEHMWAAAKARLRQICNAEGSFLCKLYASMIMIGRNFSNSRTQTCGVEV
jgi:transposase